MLKAQDEELEKQIKAIAENAGVSIEWLAEHFYLEWYPMEFSQFDDIDYHNVTYKISQTVRLRLRENKDKDD